MSSPNTTFANGYKLLVGMQEASKYRYPPGWQVMSTMIQQTVELANLELPTLESEPRESGSRIESRPDGEGYVRSFDSHNG